MKIAKPFAVTSLGSLLASLVVLLLATTASPALAANSSDSNGLTIDITRPISCTRQTHAGDTISVHYRGTLFSDGTLFDESYKRGSPFSFTLGAHQVIKGWDQGLLDMCIGEARRLTIPPELAYGERRTGPIPAGSTLVFETELMGIEGVVVGEEPVPFATSVASATAGGAVVGTTTATSEGGFYIATAPATPTAGAVSEQKDHDDSGDDDDNNDDEDEPAQNPGECKLLGPFALLVQGALGALALLSLVWKRYRETPRRPVKVWAFDASKQVLGSFLTHVLNLLMSMFSSGDFATKVASAAAAAVAVSDDQGNRPNPCSFYLLNLAIDTTIGIPILVISLRVLHALALHTPLASPPSSITSGNYGPPPYRTTWYLKQLLLYCIGLVIMKFCVFGLFQILPWIAWVGDWALRWTEGDEALQITFAMFVFPLVMNALQYYIIDSFIKDKRAGGGGVGREGYERAEQDDDDEEVVGDGRVERVQEHDDPLKEANPTPVPAGNYDPEVDGERSSGSSRRGEENKL
ncbi:hypothetical protein LTS18_002741 [Coniosporium uncinatum]|uniref:Uncharacterized protein n=1 Tax=Coniosporium uncinatum TaxID=93489 RepID=A0ACC3D7Y3_9PEZI|nr:hypothetical protein LTS18_002741 [Coniosporium uncinatum]